MTVTTEDSDAATAAITNLTTLIAAHASQPGPHAKDIFARDNLLAPIAAAKALCLSLGETLLAEQTSAAQAAIAPFTLNAVEAGQLVGELGVLRRLRGFLHGLRHGSSELGSAVGNARLEIAIFELCLAAAE